jgi:biopolymer transport protein ExbD
MSFVPEEEIKSKGIQSLAPMIDFLFIMLMFFASLAISRITIRDTEVDLVKIPSAEAHISSSDFAEVKIINISINDKGEYKWVTEVHDYPMESPEAIRLELAQQYDKGLLPEDKSKIHVLLRIDKATQWQSIFRLIFALKDEGFETRPVYQMDADNS